MAQARPESGLDWSICSNDNGSPRHAAHSEFGTSIKILNFWNKCFDFEFLEQVDETAFFCGISGSIVKEFEITGTIVQKMKQEQTGYVQKSFFTARVIEARNPRHAEDNGEGPKNSQRI